MRLILGVLLLIMAPLAGADGAYTPVLGAFLINDRLALTQRSVNPVADSATGLGFGLALDGGGSTRLSLEYSDFDMGESRQLRLLDLNVDHFFTLASLPTALRPFAGLAAGYGRLDVAPGHSQQPALGLRVGGTWALDPRLALELGARYLHTGLVTHPAAGAEFAVNADSSLWLGLEYRLQ